MNENDVPLVDNSVVKDEQDECQTFGVETMNHEDWIKEECVDIQVSNARETFFYSQQILTSVHHPNM